MILCTLVLLGTANCMAQEKFPLRSGEWEAKMSADNMPNSNMTMKYCLNDELWTRALTQNPDCKIGQFSVSASGATYTMDCSMESFQMKGKAELTFDGMEHMTGKGLFDMTINGKTSSVVSRVDYRWKGATCSPDDANLPHK
jgi:hypothetical protein